MQGKHIAISVSRQVVTQLIAASEKRTSTLFA